MILHLFNILSKKISNTKPYRIFGFNSLSNSKPSFDFFELFIKKTVSSAFQKLVCNATPSANFMLNPCPLVTARVYSAS